MSANPRPDTTAPEPTTGWRIVISYATMAVLVTVAQLHPGQWATNVASGAQFGTELLGVLVGVHILTLLMQLIAFTLSMHTGQNLIQLCRAHSPQALVRGLWVCGAIALIASDVAAILAMALAGQLLFGWTISTGVIVAGAVAVGVWHMHGRARSWLSVGLLIAICVGMAYLFTKTQVTTTVLRSSISGIPIFWHDPNARQLALAVVGATTLPHTISLTASYMSHTLGAALRPHTWRWHIATIMLALGCAGVISVASMLISASAFHGTAYQDITSIAQAYALLLPVTGTIASGFVLGFVVLATALVALMTNARARQVTWDSFFATRNGRWSRRWYGIGMTIVPTWIIAYWYADTDPSPIIIQSHVLLLIPLIGTSIVLFLLAGNARYHGTPQTTWLRWGRWVMVAVGMALSGYLLWGIW